MEVRRKGRENNKNGVKNGGSEEGKGSEYNLGVCK